MSRNAITAYELAYQTWDSVHGEGGERDQANAVIRTGLGALEHMRKYRPWDRDEATVLEGAIQGLKATLYQREQTVDDFYAAAHNESAASV